MSEGIHDPGDPALEAESRARWLHLSPGDVFVDVGAYAGSWSAPALDMGAAVVAIDSAAGMEALAAYADRIGGSDRLVRMQLTIGDGSAGTVALDSLALPAVAFIKVDVEGKELAVLRGAQTLLLRCRPRLMVEVHLYKGVTLEAVRAAIGGGYRFEVKDGPTDYYAHLYAEPGAAGGAA